MCVLYVLSHVQLFATPWTIARQAPLSMGFSRQECWSGLPLPSPGDPPDPGIEPASLNISCTGRQILYHLRHLGRAAQLHPAQTADPPNRDLKKWLLISNLIPSWSKNGLPKWCSGKESTCQCRRSAFDPWVRKIPWRRK